MNCKRAQKYLADYRAGLLDSYLHDLVDRHVSECETCQAYLKKEESITDFLHSVESPDGAVSEDGSIAGTYLHGVFDQADACQTLLAWAGLRDVQRMDYAQRCEADIDRLADAISDNLDLSIFEGMD